MLFNSSCDQIIFQEAQAKTTTTQKQKKNLSKKEQEEVIYISSFIFLSHSVSESFSFIVCKGSNFCELN